MLSPTSLPCTMTDPLGPKIADLYQGDNARPPTNTPNVTLQTTPTNPRTSPNRLQNALRRGSNDLRSASTSNLGALAGRRARSSTVGNAGYPGQLGRTERERSQMLRSISHLTKTQRPPTATNEEEQMELLNSSAGLSTAHVVSPPFAIPPPPEYEGHRIGQQSTAPSLPSRASFAFKRNRSRSVGNLLSPQEGCDDDTPTSPRPLLRRSFSRSRSNIRGLLSPSTATLTSPSAISLHGDTTPTATTPTKRRPSIPNLGRWGAGLLSRENLFFKNEEQSQQQQHSHPRLVSSPPPVPPLPERVRSEAARRRSSNSAIQSREENLSDDFNQRPGLIATSNYRRASSRDDQDIQASDQDDDDAPVAAPSAAHGASTPISDHGAKRQSPGIDVNQGTDESGAPQPSPRVSITAATTDDDNDARGHASSADVAAAAASRPSPFISQRGKPGTRDDQTQTDGGESAARQARIFQIEEQTEENEPLQLAPFASSNSHLDPRQSNHLPVSHFRNRRTSVDTSARTLPPPPPPPHSPTSILTNKVPAAASTTTPTTTQPRSIVRGHRRQQSSTSTTASSYEGGALGAAASGHSLHPLSTFASPAAAASASSNTSLASPSSFNSFSGFHDQSLRSPPRISFDLSSFAPSETNSRAASRRPSLAMLAMDTTPVQEHPSEMIKPHAANLARNPSTSGVSFADTSASSSTFPSSRTTGSNQSHGTNSVIDHGSNHQEIPVYPSPSTPASRRVSLAPSSLGTSFADDSISSVGDARRRSSALKMSKLKQWASRSSTNVATPPNDNPASARKSVDSRPPSAFPSTPTAPGRKSFSIFNSRDPRPDDAGLGKFRRSSFMKSRGSIAQTDDPSTEMPSSDGRRKSSTPASSGWFGKMLKTGAVPPKSFSRRGSAQQQQQTVQDGTHAASTTTPAMPSSEEAQRTFDDAFGPVQPSEPSPRTEGVPPISSSDHRTTNASGLPPSSHSPMPFSFNSGSTDSNMALAPNAQEDVGPMGEALTPPDETPRFSQQLGHTGFLSNNDTRSSLSSANQSNSTTPSTAQTQHTNVTLPGSKPDTPAISASADASATEYPQTGMSRSQTIGDDGFQSDAMAAEEFVDAVEIPSADSVGALSAITASEGSETMDLRAEDDEQADQISHMPVAAGQATPPTLAAPQSSTSGPPRRPGRTRSHLSHMPRLNSQQVVHRAEGSDGGSDDEQESSRDEGGHGSGGAGGDRSGGDDGSEHGSETETADEEDDGETETDTDGEGSQHDGEAMTSTAPEQPLPGSFAAMQPPSASTMTSSFSRDRSNRPGDIALPPAPTFRPGPSQDTPMANPVSRATPTPNGAGAGTIGRSSWMQFTETPFETPTPIAPGASAMNAGAATNKSASGSSEPSYFNARPAPAKNAANVQSSNMPPPSPSIISRNRAPSSSSVRSSRVVPTPGRELPPMPPIQPEYLKALAAASAAARTEATDAGRKVSPQPAIPSPHSTRERPSTAMSEMLAPARVPTSPNASATSPNSATLDSSVGRLGADPAHLRGGGRPNLYHQASRSLIDLPSSTRHRESFLDGPSSTMPATVQEQAVPGTPDFAARPPPTPKGVPELLPAMPGSGATTTQATLQRRRSMIEIAAVPPPYAIIHRRPEGPQMIYPREEEGKERLPTYACSVHIEGYLPRKMEFSAPSVQARDRSWKRCYFVLHGTCLKVFRNDLSSGPRPDWGDMKGQHVHPQPINEDGSNGGAGSTPGANLIEAMSHTSLPFGRGDDTKGGLVREYTLQGAESGLAADYLKRRHVVRVRAEGEQFLLQTTNDRHLVDWIECLQAGTNISADLETRQMPKFITLPRRRRRNRRPREAEAQEQADLAEAQRRSLADGGRGSASGNRTSARVSTNGAGAPRPSTQEDPSARFDEMLREEHEQMGRSVGSESVV